MTIGWVVGAVSYDVSMSPVGWRHVVLLEPWRVRPALTGLIT